MANCQNSCQNFMRYNRRPIPSPASGSMSCPCRADSRINSRESFPSDTPVAMAYVPLQKWENIYEPCKGLEQGTIFRDLDKPFMWKGGRCR